MALMNGCLINLQYKRSNYFTNLFQRFRLRAFRQQIDLFVWIRTFIYLYSNPFGGQLTEQSHLKVTI